MTRLALLILALVVLAPATAHAAVPCRDRVYNDWYADGKIATTYPLGCYRDALKHIPADARTYSSLSDDIRSAMQGARSRLSGHASVPSQIGKSGPAETTATVKSPSKSTTSPHDPTLRSSQQVSNTLPTSTVATGRTGSGTGVPVPLLVLGGLALLLVAVGGAGAVLKRRRI